MNGPPDPDDSSSPEEAAFPLAAYREALAPRYGVQRLLGVGGTAVVCLADDTKHGRKVAIKILKKELAETVGGNRFIAEIRTAASLMHPNIVPLLDSGSVLGLPYYVMPYVEGESLRSRLDRSGRLPVADALALTIEVADALEYAHAAGIVHRDIKPGNLLLLRSHALVADFGIARAISHASEAPSPQSVGMVFGTPAYMSPEQAVGDQAVDGRSDIYSLATVFFEAVTGDLPFKGSTLRGLIGQRFVKDAPRLHSMLPDIPVEVDEAVARGLARQPEERPPSALSFARLLTASAGGADTPVPRAINLPDLEPGGEASSPSVAVLPFQNLSGDPEDDYLSDGITEEILSTLSRLRTLRVAARTSSFAFRDRRDDVRVIADRLGVTTVLDGSVRRAGKRVRVSAQLVNAGTGFQMWSDRIDRDLHDAFEIQDDIARAIAEALSATLLTPTTPYTRSAVGGEAYELYLRGRFSLNKRTEPDLHEASRLFTRAVEANDRFALAHCGLADAHVILGIYGAAPPKDVMPPARAAAERALALDPALGEAYTTLGAVRALFDWDWAGAEDAFRRASALSPGYPAAWQWWAMNHLVPQRRFEEASNVIARAAALDPLSMVIAVSEGVVHHMAGDLDAAVTVLRGAVVRDDSFAMTHYFLGGALRDAGDAKGAESAFRAAMARGGATPEMIAGLAQTLARAGDTAGAEAHLNQLVALRESRVVSACLLAQIHLALGDRASALQELERAVRDRDLELVYLGCRPAYRLLDGDAAFEGLRARVGV